MTNTMTITETQQQLISDFLRDRHIPAGLGSKEEACSIAAINLALSGELTDRVPDCMSLVIGRWIIAVQDRMPDEMRNSSEWRSLLPLAAGTGRDKEPQRKAIIIVWMWDAMALLQPLADKRGFGVPWKTMCEEKTKDAALKSKSAAAAADAYDADAYDAAAYAAAAAAADAYDAAYAAYAAYAADPAWAKLSPAALLRTLIDAK